MSPKVKRYHMYVGKFGDVDDYESEHGIWIRQVDYTRLEQEYERLRGLLMEAKAALDPFDDKILEARINAALIPKP